MIQISDVNHKTRLKLHNNVRLITDKMMVFFYQEDDNDEVKYKVIHSINDFETALTIFVGTAEETESFIKGVSYTRIFTDKQFW